MSKQTGDVLNMMGRLDLRQYHACTLVERYWDSLHVAGALPLRSQINPRGIEDALNYAFILESLGAGHARLRVAGMHLNELMGMEVRGMPVSCLITPASREAFARALGAVLNGPAKMQLGLVAEGAGAPQQGTRLEARMLLLPLQDDTGCVNRVLGCFETKGAVATAPHRFSLTDVKKTPLEVGPLFAAAPPPVLQQGAGFAEEQAGYQTAAKRPPYLRLVKSGD